MPILMEMFGTSVCAIDAEIQADIRHIVESNPDIILLNCRMRAMETADRKDPFAHDFCDKRRRGYHRELDAFNMKNPQILIDGLYDANKREIMPAVKAARSLDHIGRIGLWLDRGSLKVDIPALQSEYKTGRISLFIYQPLVVEITSGANDLRGRAAGAPPPDVQGPKIVPPEDPVPLHFRPVVAMKPVGMWEGVPMSFSFPLSELGAFSGAGDGALGYIVVLNGETETGPVLAVGEIKAPDRYDVTVPDIYTPVSTVSGEAEAKTETPAPVTAPVQP